MWSKYRNIILHWKHTSILWLKGPGLGPGQGQTPSLEARGYALSRLKILQISQSYRQGTSNIRYALVRNF